MIALTDFEGVNGFRWGALIGGDGRLETHGRVPDQAGKRVGVIARVLQQGPFTFDGSDLVFDSGKVLVRRGAFGLLMLFMDDRVNISIVNALLLQDAEANRAGSSSASTDSHLGEVGHRAEALRRRGRLEFPDRHCSSSPSAERPDAVPRPRLEL